MSTRRLSLLLTLFAFALLPASASAQRTAPIDRLVKDALRDWQAPGLSLVVVHDDRVVYLEGFGVKELGKPGIVTPDTIFPLASCTKSFTALAIGMLADDGKLSWDDPVRRHLGFFHLSDPLADADVTLRDLACHRTGVAAHDLLWYGAPWSLEERIRRVGRLERTDSFRASFHYQVVLFGAAGLAAGRAYGGSWEQLVQDRILTPLDMKHATCMQPPAGADLASPHHRDDAGRVALMDRYELNVPDPAGSIHASARDLGKYLRCQLGDGSYEDRWLITKANLEEPHTPQVTLRLDSSARELNPETRFLNYGLGWIVQDYRGKRMIMHGGAIDGFRAHITLVPEEKLGIALLNNLDGRLLNLALSNGIVDHFLGAPAKDWSGYYLRFQERLDEAARERKRFLRAFKVTPPPLPLSAYAGRYEEKAYGSCGVELRDGVLSLCWGNVKAALQPHEGSTFRLSHPITGDIPVSFSPGGDGAIASLEAFGRVFRKVR